MIARILPFVTDLAFLALDQGIIRKVESFFAALKTELLVNAHPYQTRQEEVRTRSLSMGRGFPIGPAAIPRRATQPRGVRTAGRPANYSVRPWEVNNAQIFNDL